MSDAPVQNVTVAGLRTAYAVAMPSGVEDADRLPILALHGWMRTWQDFWPVAQLLAPQGWAVYAPDLPGFGGTQAPPEAWGVTEYAQFVVALLDALGLERVHLLGHSFGGRIGLVLAAKQPNRIGKMVLANSAGVRPPGNPLRDSVVGVGKKLLRLPGLNRFYEPLRRRAYAWLGATDYLDAGPLQETFLKVIAEDLLPYAARVCQPTLLIWGDRDRDTPLWQARQLERAIPDAGLYVFEGAGHFSFLERLPEYVRAVAYFLSQEDAEEGA